MILKLNKHSFNYSGYQMKKIILLILLCIASSQTVFATDANNIDGMIVKASMNNVSQTIDRLEQVLKSKGVTVFLRLDHAAGANKIGNALRPTQLLIFGNPKLGSPLMMSNQSIGIDLPLKAVAWEDANGKVWLGYNTPDSLSKRHHITDREPVVAKMSKVLDKFSTFATSKAK